MSHEPAPGTVARVTEAPTTHRVRAHNADTESENKIHDDAVARRYGFGGGLVPGVTLYAYMTHAPAARWGRAWLERGTMTARFAKPVYDGEEVEIVGEPAEAGGGGAKAGPPRIAIRLVGPDGEVRATGEATLPDGPEPVAAEVAAGYPERPLPSSRPPADETSLAPGNVLGTVAARYRASSAPPFLVEIHEDLDLYAGDTDGSGPVAHPGWLIRFANAAVSSNVALGPWIHVESEATHLGAVVDGTEVRFRSRVADEYERRGHRFALIDGLLVATDDPARPGRPVMRVRHRVIHRLRG